MFHKALGGTAACMIILALSLFASIGIAGEGDAAEQSRVEVAYFGAKNDVALLGVGQGLEDSRSRGREFHLRIVGTEYITPIDDPKPVAIFAAVGPKSLQALSKLNPGVPIFNLVASQTKLRARCLPNVVHVIPSKAMRTHAVIQWQKRHPESKPKAVAWHPKWKKYDAAQLNSRFEKKRGTPMTEQAWAGWAAARMLVQSLEQRPGKDSERLLDYLKTEMTFDGHKGAEMSVRVNGQVRQVLLLVEDDKIIGTAPVGDQNDLDSLGYNYCPKPPDQPKAQ